MRVIFRIQLIRRRIPQLLERLRHRREVIHIPHALPNTLPNRLRVPDKPRRSIAVHTAFPLVVRRLAAHDHLCALGDVRLRSVGDVLIERVHCLAGLARNADLVAGARTVAAAVVGSRVRRAAVVVPEFDHHDVVGCEQGRESGEAAFVGVAAGGAAADGFVDDGGVVGEEGGDVGAPAWWVESLVWSSGSRDGLFRG